MYYIIAFFILSLFMFLPMDIRLELNTGMQITPELNVYLFRYKLKKIIMNEDMFIDPKMSYVALKGFGCSDLFGLMNIKRVNVIMQIGINGNPFATAVCVFGIRSVAISALNVFLRNKTRNIDVRIFPKYSQSVFLVKMCGIISLSVADLAVSILRLLSCKTATGRKEVQKNDY